MEPRQRIGDYEVLDELGRGGMGRVYRVRNVIADRVEAMKVLHAGAAGSPEMAARFLREIRVLAALDHPNIAVLRTAVSHGDQVVMIMELVEGEPLSKRLRQGPLPIPEAIACYDRVLAALAYAHERQVVHRDVKPSNIMVAADGTIKLTDFGIARSVTDRSLTMSGTTAGSVAYMSPEQVRGEAVDARSDLYSAGISLYQTVTGQPPFGAGSEFQLMAAHLEQEPVPPAQVRPEVPPALNAVILRAMAKRSGDRFQSAAAFREALGDVAAPTEAPVDATRPIVRPDQRATSPPVPAIAAPATAGDAAHAPRDPSARLRRARRGDPRDRARGYGDVPAPRRGGLR